MSTRANASERAMVRAIPIGILLTNDTRKIFVSKTVDESHSARILIGCKPISLLQLSLDDFAASTRRANCHSCFASNNQRSLLCFAEQRS